MSKPVSKAPPVSQEQEDAIYTFPDLEAAIHKTLDSFHETITVQLDELVEAYEQKLKKGEPPQLQIAKN